MKLPNSISRSRAPLAAALLLLPVLAAQASLGGKVVKNLVGRTVTRTVARTTATAAGKTIVRGSTGKVTTALVTTSALKGSGKAGGRILTRAGRTVTGASDDAVRLTGTAGPDATRTTANVVSGSSGSTVANSTTQVAGNVAGSGSGKVTAAVKGAGKTVGDLPPTRVPFGQGTFDEAALRASLARRGFDPIDDAVRIDRIVRRERAKAARLLAASRGTGTEVAATTAKTVSKQYAKLEKLGRQAAGARGKQASTILQRMAKRAGLDVLPGANHLTVKTASGRTVTQIPHSPHAKGTIRGIVDAILKEVG